MIHVQQRGPIRILTIDSPDTRNALDAGAFRTLAAGLSTQGAGAVVMTGAGSRSFCSGADLRALREQTQELGDAVHEFLNVLESPDRLPAVAAVRGTAAGGGAELAMNCELVVAAEDASFVLPEVGRGLVPGGGALLLPTRLPLAISNEFVLLGEPFDAQALHRFGLVNRVVSNEQVLRVAVDLAARLASQPSDSLALARRLLRTTATRGPAATARDWEATVAAAHAGQ